MTPAGLDQLKSDEGLSLTAYPDPRTGGAPWTIGYGCTGPGITEGTIWTQAQANGAILGRTMILSTLLSRKLPFWSDLTSVRQDVLVNIAYNIGVSGLIKWPITLAVIGRGDYKSAADDIRTNKTWVSEVKDRANRCADALEFNTW